MVTFIPDTFLSNTPITVAVTRQDGANCHEVYQINPAHRNRNPQKSQWSIDNRGEPGVFAWSLENISRDPKGYWGVCINNGECLVLGLTVSQHDTKIALFVANGQPQLWHGYPADYITNPQCDCPNRTVLKHWAEIGIISKARIAKLTSGKGWKD